MFTSCFSPRHCRSEREHGFTLVELLVVVGIIGLLVSILIPSVSRAREIAKATVCASNLRQIGVAMNAYTLDNNALMPSRVDSGGTIWPEGLFWSNHLVRTKYISVPTDPSSMNDHVFRCPSGSDEEAGLNGFASKSPRDPMNRGYVAAPYPAAANTVRTWYSLNGAENGGGVATNANAYPFIWAKNTNTAILANGQYTRSRGRITQPTRLVMAFDGGVYNWASYPGDTGFSARISGRHGEATNYQPDGVALDGFFNCLFFDGHVSLLPTEPYTLRGLRGEPSVTIFYLADQK